MIDSKPKGDLTNGQVDSSESSILACVSGQGEITCSEKRRAIPTLAERQAEMKAAIEARKPRMLTIEECREATHEDLVKSLLERSYEILPREGFPAIGWVYVIRIIGDGPVKIGMTYGRLPWSRLRDIAQSLPFEISLLALGRALDARVLEDRLHVIFGPKRIKGEWFNLDLADIETILGMPHFQLSECVELVGLYRGRGL